MLDNKKLVCNVCIYEILKRRFYLFFYLQGNPVNSCGFAFVFGFHHWKHFLRECVLFPFVGIFLNCFPQRLVMMVLRSWLGCAHELCAVCSGPVPRGPGLPASERGRKVLVSDLLLRGRSARCAFLCTQFYFRLFFP